MDRPQPAPNPASTGRRVPCRTMPRRTAVVCVALMALTASGCGGKQPAGAPPVGAASPVGDCEAPAGRLTIATGNAGGAYFVMGGGIAKLLSDTTPLKTTAQPTGASVANVQGLVKGYYDVAFAGADTAYDAVHGRPPFAGRQNIAALARIHTNHVHVVVRSDAGIRSFADLKGKRLSIGSTKSSTEQVSLRLMAAAGLKPTDVALQRLELAKAVDALKAGQIDGFVQSMGAPVAQIAELTGGGGRFGLLDVTPLLPAMKKETPFYEAGVIPKAVYRLPADVKTITTPNVLLARGEFPAATACAVVKAVFSHTAQLVGTHKAFAEYDAATAVKLGDIPINPGAAKALKAVAGG